MRRSVVFTVVLVLALLVGGVAGVVMDATARVDAVYADVGRVTAEQADGGGFIRDYLGQPAFVKGVVVSAMLDGAPPHIVATNGQVQYGAFGLGGYLPAGLRPWSPSLTTAPIGVGLVLAITATLVAASRWSPRPAATRSQRPGRAPAPRGRPVGS